jgi:homoserine kinase type II
VTAFPPDVCPGVRRRVERVAEWNALVGSAWRPELSPADPVSPWAERAWHHVSWQITEIPRQLAAWINRAVPLQPCLADVWHNHVLFEGERLTGIVDYGGVKIDHVAVDLARLLGSLVGDDRQMWAAGLAAYRRVRPLSAEEEALAFALDRTGIVIGAANWLRWLYRDRHAFADREAVARRLAELAGRMERWDQE